jgi:hypothetical protein
MEVWLLRHAEGGPREGMRIGASRPLVGYAPQLGRLLGRLVTGEPEGDIPMSKADAACVSFEGLERRGRLRPFLPARVLERLGVL